MTSCCVGGAANWRTEIWEAGRLVGAEAEMGTALGVLLCGTGRGGRGGGIARLPVGIRCGGPMGAGFGG